MDSTSVYTLYKTQILLKLRKKHFFYDFMCTGLRYWNKEINRNPNLSEYSHRSSRQRSVCAGWTAPRPRWGASASPCLRSCRTWEDSSAARPRPSPSESAGAGGREQRKRSSWGFPENPRNKHTHPPVFGFNGDFVTVEIFDLHLDVGLFLVRDPGPLLTWQRTRHRWIDR